MDSLTDYEKWISSELRKGHFSPVKDFNKWKEALEKAAGKALDKAEVNGVKLAPNKREREYWKCVLVQRLTPLKP